ncbi:MAG TPA: UDP-N-acetylmuramoyl-L-alanine--D-glutamate ligase [Candidatus Limnocylindrales bacterium]|nr:UDP-N-acetylmuramoyl-L-alanine--D-glutamate ligase [Candidatus Limnocylindrales bacterium]
MTATMATGTPLDLDRLTIDDVRDAILRDRPVTVLGFARSGIALARFLADAGARVTIYDGRPEAELADAMAQLDGRSVRLVAGPGVDPAVAWEGAALVTTSPSINPDYPTTEPRLRAALTALVTARRAGDPTAPALVSEADLFLRLCPAPTVGVTGTKGKTTTASLIAAVLAADAAHPVVLGGNIGVPLIERLPELTPDHRVVIELSELQLPTLSRGTTVAVYTNVTSDHLDRHGSLESYRAVKRRLAELVDPNGALILNVEDPVVATYADLGTAPVVPYRRGSPDEGGVGISADDDPWIVAREVPRLAAAGGGDAETGPAGRVMPLAGLQIPGWHSISNALAAVAAGLVFGVPPDAIRHAVAEFQGVEHRLEEVAIVDRVRFVNDSQGTQPDAVIAAVQAFRRPIVLIAGGRDKGVDLSDLAREVAQATSAVVLIGESGPTMAELFSAAGHERVELADTLESAVLRADDIARELLADAGPADLATVLLSPAAASFDMFVDYAARGRAFKAAVAELADERRERRTS